MVLRSMVVVGVVVVVTASAIVAIVASFMALFAPFLVLLVLGQASSVRLKDDLVGDEPGCLETRTCLVERCG